jgi:hypothetical protein
VFSELGGREPRKFGTAGAFYSCGQTPDGGLTVKTFVLAAAAAVATLGFAGTAGAQVGGFNYRTYNPYTGSFINRQSVVTPFGAQTVRAYSNPFNGNFGQAGVFQGPFGAMSGSAVRYNPYLGLGYTSGFYNPGVYGNPYLGYRYGFYFR